MRNRIEFAERVKFDLCQINLKKATDLFQYKIDTYIEKY